MKRKSITLFIFIFILLPHMLLAASVDILADTSVVYLGNPFKQSYPDGSGWEYARNVWDMMAWQSRIYFGIGDVARNAGPVDLWYYDTSDKRFINEFTVDDELIIRFRPFNSTLYIPGYDATESWDYGNFYLNSGGGWQKFRTIPGEIHVIDIYSYNDKLFACGSRGMYVSTDGGNAWEQFQPGGQEFFTLNDSLYCVGNRKRIFRYTGSGFEEQDHQLYSGLDDYDSPGIGKSHNYKNHLVYLVMNHTAKNESALFKTTTLHNPDFIDFFNAKSIRDILVKHDTLFVMTSTAFGNDFLTECYSTTDLQHWHKRFDKVMPSFSRCFEYLDGSFYISLACEDKKFFCGDVYKIIPSKINIDLPLKTATRLPKHMGFSAQQQPRLIWRRVPNAETYHLQYALDEKFKAAETITVSNISDTTLLLPESFPVSTVLYWRVQAQNSSGSSDYSNPASFMIHPNYMPEVAVDLLSDSSSSATFSFLNNGQIADQTLFTWEYPRGSDIQQLFVGEVWGGGYTGEGSLGIFGREYDSPWIPTAPFTHHALDGGVMYSCSYSDEKTYLQGAGLQVRQNIYSYENQDYIILEYSIRNSGRNGFIDDLYWGIFLNLEVTSSPQYMWMRNDMAAFDSTRYLSYMFENLEDKSSALYAGVAALENQPCTHRFWGWDDQILYTPEGIYEAMSSQIIQPPSDSEFDYKIAQAHGPFHIQAGDSVTLAMALVWGRGLESIRTAAQEAKFRYQQSTKVNSADDHSMPDQHALLQNYPNPFNAGTRIEFHLSRASSVTLTIFNAMGQRIRTLIDQSMSRGVHRVRWDGTTAGGKAVSSGVYFYRLKTETFTLIKKGYLIR